MNMIRADITFVLLANFAAYGIIRFIEFFCYIHPLVVFVLGITLANIMAREMCKAVKFYINHYKEADP